MTIENFRNIMAYASTEATKAEKKEARGLAKAIIERNEDLINRLAVL